jgi:hypothetical protein
VPTRSPDGAGVVEKAFAPLAVRIPAVNVDAPVPPLPTEIGLLNVVPVPKVLLVRV